MPSGKKRPLDTVCMGQQRCHDGLGNLWLVLLDLRLKTVPQIGMDVIACEFLWSRASSRFSPGRERNKSRLRLNPKHCIDSFHPSVPRHGKHDFSNH